MANIITDKPYYSEALGVKIETRKQRDKILNERGLRILEKGEKIEPKKKTYELSEEKKKDIAYIKSHGVNWNFIEKRCPQLLPKRK